MTLHNFALQMSVEDNWQWRVKDLCFSTHCSLLRIVGERISEEVCRARRVVG